MFKGSPSAVAILTKMVNMAMRPKWRIRHFRQICHFRQNHHFSRDPFGPLWISPNLSFFPICRFRHSSLFKGPFGRPWIFAKPLTNFRQICHFRCCMHFWSYEKLAGLLLLKEIKPPPERKIKWLLTFENLFSPLRYSQSPPVRNRITTAVTFLSKMTLVHARALLSIEKISTS